MDKFNYYIEALKKYAKFSGRASLSQFWYFMLFNFVISFILGLINQNLGGLYGLVVLIPSLAVGARRLHDIGKSGWWQLMGLIPLFGWGWLACLFTFKGDTGNNDYGEPAIKTEKVLKGDSKFEQEAKKFSDKVEDFTHKVSEKIEDKVESFGEKIEDKIESFGEKKD